MLRLASFLPTRGHVSLHRRHYLVNSLSEGFLDIASVIPLPPSFPPYATTIIILTVLSRAAQVPIAVWAKRRRDRFEDIVIPAVKKNVPVIQKQVLLEMKAQGLFTGNVNTVQKYHASRTGFLVEEFQKQLLIKYKCSLRPTFLVPFFTQLPIFVLGTTIFSHASTMAHSPLGNEAFLTFTSLTHPDATMTVPICLGIITMMNVESNTWMFNATERASMAKKKAIVQAEGGVSLMPKEIMKTVMRLLSVGRILLTAVMPGSIAIYWTTSAAFGLLQTWAFDWMALQRRRRKAESTLETLPPPTDVLPLPPTKKDAPQTKKSLNKCSKKQINGVREPPSMRLMDAQ